MSSIHVMNDLAAERRRELERAIRWHRSRDDWPSVRHFEKLLLEFDGRGMGALEPDWTWLPELQNRSLGRGGHR